MKLRALIVAACLVLTQQTAAWAADDSEIDKANKFYNKFLHDLILPAMDKTKENKFAEAQALLDEADKQVKALNYKDADAKSRIVDFEVDILEKYADLYVAQEKYDLAGKAELSAYEKLKAVRQRGNSEMICKAGEYYLEGKNYAQAEATFEKAIKELDDVDWVDAQKGLWITYLNQDKKDQLIASIAAASERVKKIGYPTLTRQFRFALKEIYDDLGDKVNSAKVEAQLNDKHCPLCGSDKSQEPIVYGLPAGEMKDVHLGGCIVTEESPHWYCTKDKVSF